MYFSGVATGASPFEWMSDHVYCSGFEGLAGMGLVVRRARLDLEPSPHMRYSVMETGLIRSPLPKTYFESTTYV